MKNENQVKQIVKGKDIKKFFPEYFTYHDLVEERDYEVDLGFPFYTNL